jgi:hypothetical protein
MTRSVASTLFVVLTACTSSSRQPGNTGFSGTWVMSLEGRPFIVLTLEPDGDAFSGTLARPRTMTTDGLSFSGIGGEIIAERVVGTRTDGTPLRLVAQNPTDPADTTEFEFYLTSDDGAALKPAGAPFEPWPFTRHHGADIPQVAKDWDAARSYPLLPPEVAPNSEMAEIYKADQAIRQSLDAFQAQAERISAEDAARRDRVRVLLDSGALRAAEDFRLAAMVFQHGSEPRDYILAHTLALVALARGDRSAAWIAAASLDRYLHAIGQPQIFGSQFSRDALSQEPYDRTLVSDALRRELGVPALDAQQEQIKSLLQPRR